MKRKKLHPFTDFVYRLLLLAVLLFGLLIAFAMLLGAVRFWPGAGLLTLALLVLNALCGLMLPAPQPRAAQTPVRAASRPALRVVRGGGSAA